MNINILNRDLSKHILIKQVEKIVLVCKTFNVMKKRNFYKLFTI